MSLTDHERDVIAKARELAKAIGADETAAALGFGLTADSDVLWPAAFGTAQTLLFNLADIAERLGGE